MTHQIAFGTRDDDLLAEDATGRGSAGVVDELNDQLTMICGLAYLGGEASYDAELTESYFAQIEAAGKKAAQITGQLLVPDPSRLSEEKHTKAVTWPAAQHASDATTDRRPVGSSFQRRMTAARALVTKAGD